METVCQRHHFGEMIDWRALSFCDAGIIPGRVSQKDAPGKRR